MIVLPTRKRLERRRDALYKHLFTVVTSTSIHEVEYVMRQIHGINRKLKNYFVREGQHEAAELFEEKDDFEVKFPIEAEDPVMVSIEELQGENEI
jgi:hypothetical protein